MRHLLASWTSTPARLVAFVVLVVTSTSLALTGCQREYDFSRPEPRFETLGHELFQIWRKDAARAPQNAAAKTQMLDANYTRFVDAVDAMAPADQLEEVDRLLVNLLALVDEGLVPALTRKLHEVLQDAQANPALLEALAVPSAAPAESFVSNTLTPNLPGYATGYPELTRLVELSGRIVTANDGITDDGSRTFDEPAAVADMLRVLARQLRELDQGAGASDEPLAVIARDLALVQDYRYLPQSGSVPSVPVALYDSRGYPLARVDAQGRVVAPFQDADGDGLADVDADGRFLLGAQALEVRPFAAQSTLGEPFSRDDVGRATLPGGEFAFQYVDLSATALGFLVRHAGELSREDTFYDLLRSGQVVMGSKTTHTDDIGGYLGYPADQPLMGMSHALIGSLDTPALPVALEGMGELVDRYPDRVAALAHAVGELAEVLDRHPEAAMRDESTLLYDLIPLMEELSADPALFADVMAAMRDPITPRLGESLVTLIRFNDGARMPSPDGPYEACFQNCRASYELGSVGRFDCIRSCPMGELFSRPTDHTAPESEDGRSLLQKLMHLIRDTTGQPYSMDLLEASYNGNDLPALPPLLVLPGAAEAMVASIGGNLDLANYVPDNLWSSDFGELLSYLGVDSGNVAEMLSTLSPLFGTGGLDRHATPDQITRLFNREDLRYEDDNLLIDVADPTCRDGYKVADHLAYLLFHAEAAGVVDALHPLARAFSLHGKEHILTQLHVVMHDHYSGMPSLYRTAAGAPSPMKGANLRSYEPALAEILDSVELLQALHEVAKATHALEQESGLPLTDALRQSLQAATRANQVNHRGESWVNAPDGRTINGASHLHHLVASVEEAGARLDATPGARERLEGAVGNLADFALGTVEEGGAPARFTRSGSAPLLAHTLGYAADRARQEADAGRLSPWLRDEVLSTFTEAWTSRWLAGAVDLASSTLEVPEDRAVVDGFVAYMAGSPQGQTQLMVALHQLLVISVNPQSWRPIAAFFADVIDPDRPWGSEPLSKVPLVSLVAQTSQKTLAVDPDNAGIFLIHRGLTTPRGGEAPADVVVDVVARYFSPDPSAETFGSAEDYRQFIGELSAWIADDAHGMERVYELVDKRARD